MRTFATLDARGYRSSARCNTRYYQRYSLRASIVEADFTTTMKQAALASTGQHSERLRIGRGMH